MTNDQIFKLLLENTAKLNTVETVLSSNINAIRCEINDNRDKCLAEHSLVLAKTTTTENEIEQLKAELAKTNILIGNMMRDKVTADIVLSNIPIFTNESKADLFNLVSRIGDEIGFKDREAYVAIFRLSSERAPAPSINTKTFCPRILLKFNNTFSKQSFMKLYFRHGSLDLTSIGLSTRTRIYCNDSLLPNDAATLKEALRLKKTGKIHGVKIRNGKIFVFVYSGDEVPFHANSARDLHNRLQSQ